MQVKSIAEYSKESIIALQYLRPSQATICHLRSLFCLFLSGRFTQVLLYTHLMHTQQGANKYNFSVEETNKMNLFNHISKARTLYKPAHHSVPCY